LDQDADIFLAGLDPGTHVVRERELLPRLAPEEQARYHSFSAEPRRHTWLAGRELLLAALAHRAGEPDAAALLTEASGGVRYAGGRVYLNLSHSGEWLAAAVSRVPVGIDIERLRPRAVAAQVERIFCEDETRWLKRQAEPLLAFYTLWTLKEAACKAAGLTIWDALRSACFDPESGRCSLSPPFPTGDWCFLHASFQPGWRLALALYGLAGTPRVGYLRRSDERWEESPLPDAARVTAA
jgi:phosphopantetheinyl transferase